MSIVVIGDILHFRPHTSSIVQRRESLGLDSPLVDQRLSEVQSRTPVESHSEKQHPAIEVVQLLERATPTFRERQGMFARNSGCRDTTCADGLHRMIAPQSVRPRTERLADGTSCRGSCPGIEDWEMFSHVGQPSFRHSWSGPRRRIRAMRRCGRHDQRTPLSKHVQERTHHCWRTTDNPTNADNRIMPHLCPNPLIQLTPSLELSA